MKQKFQQTRDAYLKIKQTSVLSGSRSQIQTGRTSFHCERSKQRKTRPNTDFRNHSLDPKNGRKPARQVRLRLRLRWEEFNHNRLDIGVIDFRFTKRDKKQKTLDESRREICKIFKEKFETLRTSLFV